MKLLHTRSCLQLRIKNKTNHLFKLGFN